VEQPGEGVPGAGDESGQYSIAEPAERGRALLSEQLFDDEEMDLLVVLLRARLHDALHDATHEGVSALTVRDCALREPFPVLVWDAGELFEHEELLEGAAAAVEHVDGEEHQSGEGVVAKSFCRQGFGLGFVECLGRERWWTDRVRPLSVWSGELGTHGELLCPAGEGRQV
jgi:hypothetical protein